MHLRHHALVTRRALGGLVSPAALDAIVRANFAQDALRNQLGHPEIHYDDSAFAAGDRRVEALRRAAVAAREPQAMWAAFGALVHSVQDFYSHSNYVALWVARHGGYGGAAPEAIDPLDPSLLTHPDLHSGDFVLRRDWIYLLPGQRLIQRLWPPHPRSHAAMNLDGPETGPAFPYSLVAAEKRTRHEFDRTLASMRESGGEERAGAFVGRL